MRNRKLTPGDLGDQIKEIQAHLDSLKSYLAGQRRRHKKLDVGNDTYDPIEYQTFQIMLHAALIRGGMDLTKSFKGADGNGKQFCELDDGTLFRCYA